MTWNKIYVSKMINEMANVDQKLRFSSNPQRDLVSFIIYAVDLTHNYKIRELIKEFGFPTSKTVSKATMKKFWLLVQHQDNDLEIQKQCLEKCDFIPENRAYLTDRILVNSGKKQLYGTQFYKRGNRLIPRPIEDIKNLDKRRKVANLNSFSVYKKQMEVRGRKMKIGK